jgi:hypothetical protein
VISPSFFIVIAFNRGSLVKSFTRGSGLALAFAVLLGLAGCSGSNESEAARAKNDLGDSGLPTAKGDPTTPVPKSQAEWFQQKGDPYQQGGYPGTGKMKKDSGAEKGKTK